MHEAVEVSCFVFLTREEVAVSHTEFNFDVNSVRILALNERRPEPVVDVVVSDITYNIRAPVDVLFKVGEALFNPLQVGKKGQRKKQKEKARK